MNPTPDDAGWLKATVGAMGAMLMALGSWALSHTHKRIDLTVEKMDFEQYTKLASEKMNLMHDEIATQRGHIGKVFDRMQVMDEKSYDRHVELLNAIHEAKK